MSLSRVTSGVIDNTQNNYERKSNRQQNFVSSHHQYYLYTSHSPNVWINAAGPPVIKSTFKYISIQQARKLTLIYETFGRELVVPVDWVVMVRMVRTPNEMRAGTASIFIQKDTQDNMTISAEGT